MKKLLLLALVVCGGVLNASAEDDIYLRTDFTGNDLWSSDDVSMKFTFTGTNGNNEDVYTYIINADDIKSDDVWFRLHINGWGAQICPYTTNGSFTFSNFSNGKDETYGAKYERTYFQGDEYSFGIPHSTIKASKYQITLYKGNSEVYYENENCKVMWIKVDIVSMPASVSNLGFSTFSCNRALDLDNASSGLTAYKASVNNDNTVVLTKVTGKVKAETGLILAGASGTIPVVTSSEGVDISETNSLVASVAETTLTPQSSSDGYYYFLAGTTAETLGFYKLESEYKSAAGKAYLATKVALASDPVTSRAAWIFDDETQGISSVEGVQPADVVYDLQGRVARGVKAGLYIKNGKKVVLK